MSKASIWSVGIREDLITLLRVSTELSRQFLPGFRFGPSAPASSRSAISEGIEHSVPVPAESLYEAAIEAMAAFQHSVLDEMPLGPGTRLTIRVKAPEEEHTISVSKVLSWLDGGARSPSEQLENNRLRERLRM